MRHSVNSQRSQAEGAIRTDAKKSQRGISEGGVASPQGHPFVDVLAHLDKFSNQKNSVVGKLSEVAVLQECLRRGWSVFEPVLPTSEIDLILQVGSGKFWRVQVKTARMLKTSTNSIQFGLMRGGGGKHFKNRRAYTNIDVFIVVMGGEFWVVPAGYFRKLSGCTSIARNSMFYEAWDYLEGKRPDIELVQREPRKPWAHTRQK